MTNVTTLELALTLPLELHDLLVAELDATGFTGFLQDDASIKAYLPLDEWTPDLKAHVINWCRQQDIPTDWTETRIEPQDWNEVWESSIQPIEIPPFYVRPSWAPAREDLIEIVVDPKMSFGTGHHETTRLLLKMMPDYISAGKRVLDAGTGTAILVIGALKLGADSALAFDVDPWVSDNVQENLKLNKVNEQITYREGAIDVVPETGFDVLLANINRNVLLDYLETFAEKVVENGYLMLSGVLVEDQGMMVRAAWQAGFQLVESGAEGTWWAGVFKRIVRSTGSTVATIDVGTNTALLLISSFEKGRLIALHDETRFVRLGQGVDAAGVVNDAAFNRLANTLKYFQHVLEPWQVSDVIIGATSASRDASNQTDLINFVKQETGFEYIIISGLEEATWSFAGVGVGMEGDHAEIITLDIGGGSTELTAGRLQDGAYVMEEGRSLNAGSVRLTEKFFKSQPPVQKMVEEADEWLKGLLDTLPATIKESKGMLVGASGTTTVLALLEAGMDGEVSASESMLGLLSIACVNKWDKRLLKMTEADVLALNPSIMKGREDVFPAGVRILKRIMEYLGKDEVHVNTWGLRHGLALRYWLARLEQ